MDSITFKNFRQFKDETTFELKNINILVGKNNSGKSTLTKGLRLYLDNLKNLKINLADIHTTKAKDESGKDMYIGRRYTPFFRMVNAFNNPHLGTYGRAFSKESKDDYILFSARFGHIVIETIVSRYYRGDDGNIVDCFNKSSAPISQITICDDNMASRCILNFEKHIQTIEIDARENSVLYKVWEKNIEEIQSRYRRVRPDGYIWDEMDKWRIDRLNFYLSVKHKEFIKFEIDLLNGTFADDVNDDDDADAAFDRSSDGSFCLYPSLLKYALYNCGSSPDFFYDYVCEEDSMLHELSNFDQETGTDYSLYFLEDVFSKTRDDLTHFINQAQVEYIEAHSVTHSIVYNGSDKNDYMAQTILHYLNENIRENDPEKEFVEDWMMKFDIGEDFEIESIGGECYKLGIIEDVDHPENITPLLDKGVGSNQIMILLLQLATIMHKNRGASVPPMVIIEEPEQNLHPKLQSCLADLFREVYLYPLKQNKNSRGISFIIETHSEYLVRKSQVLVAKREQTDANPFTVFYMEKGKEPREIRYQDSGVFYDDFGEGFYDEAISLTEEIV